MVLNRYLPLGMLDRGNAGVSMDAICIGNVTYCTEGIGKGLFREIISWAAAKVRVPSQPGLGWCFMVLGVFRVGLSFFMPWDWEGVSGWVDSRGVWNVTHFAIFSLLRVITVLRGVDGASFSTLNL